MTELVYMIPARRDSCQGPARNINPIECLYDPTSIPLGGTPASVDEISSRRDEKFTQARVNAFSNTLYLA